MLDCEELFFPLTTTSFRHVRALELKGYKEAFIHVKNIPFIFLYILVFKKNPKLQDFHISSDS